MQSLKSKDNKLGANLMSGLKALMTSKDARENFVEDRTNAEAIEIQLRAYDFDDEIAKKIALEQAKE